MNVTVPTKSEYTAAEIEQIRQDLAYRRRLSKESATKYAAAVIAKKYDIAKRATYVKTGTVPGWDDKLYHDHFIVILTREWFNESTQRMVSASMELRFHGSAHDAKENPQKLPHIYDVLACVQKVDPGTFEDFCADFGYDTDSRKALATYEAVKKEYEGFKALFPYGVPEDIVNIW